MKKKLDGEGEMKRYLILIVHFHCSNKKGTLYRGHMAYIFKFYTSISKKCEV